MFTLGLREDNFDICVARPDFSGGRVLPRSHAHQKTLGVPHSFAYIPSERVLKEGGYEGGDAMRYSVHPGPFQKGIEQAIFEEVNRALQRTQSAAK